MTSACACIRSCARPLHRDDRIDATRLVTLPANVSGLACIPMFVEARGMRLILSIMALALALALAA
jgi:hypothetical protein